jgi:hypothetical protein
VEKRDVLEPVLEGFLGDLEGVREQAEHGAARRAAALPAVLR